MLPTPPPPVYSNNPNYTTPYKGYYYYATAASTSLPLSLATKIASFTGTCPTGTTVIPNGVWQCLVNIYSFQSPSGSPPWADPSTPVQIEVYAKAYKNSDTLSNAIGTYNSSRSILVSGLVDNPYSIPIEVPNPIAISTSDTIYVDFYVSKIYQVSGSYVNTTIEFWTEGDSISQVTTTFAPQSGPQGNTGPQGITGPQGNTGASGIAGSPAAPPGAIMAYAGSPSSKPSGWLICDGSEYNGDDPTYNALFNVILTRYGSGRGEPYFQVPNLKQKMIVGVDTNLLLATTGGSSTVTLAANQIPNHEHDVSLTNNGGVAGGGNGTYANGVATPPTGGYNGKTGSIIYDAAGNIAVNAGQPPAAVNVMNPYLVLYYIIKL
jgi:microcystin-dependent protein